MTTATLSKKTSKNLWNLSQDELMRERLEAEDKQRRDRLSQIDTAHEEGLESGRREEREASALKMILKGQEALEISEATGLSEDEIKALQKK